MKKLSAPIYILLFFCTAYSINTTSPGVSSPSNALSTPSVAPIETPVEKPTETPIYIPIQEMLDVTVLDISVLDLSHLSDDERDLVEILMNYLPAYLNNDLKSIEPYLDDSFVLEIPNRMWNISKIILKWNIGEISHEKAVMVFEFHLSDYEFYLYNEVYLSKISDEWKIYDSTFQP